VTGQAQSPSLRACASRLSELCQRFFTALSVLQARTGSGCARARTQRARGSSCGARRRTCQAGAWQCRPSGCHMPGGPAARACLWCASGCVHQGTQAPFLSFKTNADQRPLGLSPTLMSIASSSTLKATFFTSGESWLYLGPAQPRLSKLDNAPSCVYSDLAQRGLCYATAYYSAPAQPAVLPHAPAAQCLRHIRPRKPRTLAASKLVQDLTQALVLLHTDAGILALLNRAH